MFVSNRTKDNTTKADRDLISDMIDLLHSAYDYGCQIRSRYGKQPSFNCHSMCRALNMFYGNDVVTLHDGTYRGLVREEDGWQWRPTIHSWLKTMSGSIIDPYPVGILSPIPLLYVHGGPDCEAVHSHFHEEPIHMYREFDAKAVYKSSYALLGYFTGSSDKESCSNQWTVATS